MTFEGQSDDAPMEEQPVAEEPAADQDAGAVHGDPAAPTPFPPAPTDPLLADSVLQTCLESAIADVETQRGFDPGTLGVAFAISELTSWTGWLRGAGHRQDETHYIASEAKVGVMYAAYALRAMARRVASATGASTADGLFAELRSQMDPSIRSAITRIADATNISEVQRLPNYKAALAVAPSSAGGVDVDFTPAYDRALELMIVPSDNNAAATCVHGLGYGYINGALSAAGFFDPVGEQGLWVAGDFLSGAQWQSVRIASTNDGAVAQAGTARQMLRLVVTIFNYGLLDTSSCDEMLARLNRAAAGPDTPWIARAGVLDSTSITHNKLGLGPLKAGGNVRSEVSVLQNPISVAVGTTSRSYAIAWQNLLNLNPVGFGDIATIWRDTITAFEAAP